MVFKVRLNICVILFGLTYMISTLPKSLIETASEILKKPRSNFAYVSFRDVNNDDVEQTTINEKTGGSFNDWQNTTDNNRTVLNHIEIDHTHTDDDKTHVYRYTAASKPLNKLLYANHKEGKESPDKMDVTGAKNFTHDLKGIDAAIHRNKLSHELVSYSGINWHPMSKADHENVIHLPAYTSTSLSKKVAHGFAKSGKKTPDVKDIHILKIHSPAGSAGMYTHDDPAITHYEGENEYIVPRNTSIRVHPTPEVFTDKDGHNVHVWTAHRARSPETVDTNYKTPDSRTELYNNNGLKVYQTHTLSALKTHYPDMYASSYGADFHEHHVASPVIHIHTPDNKVWQSSLEDGDTVFRQSTKSYSPVKASLDAVIKKYPQISHLKDAMTRKDAYSKDDCWDQ